jgi:hypothetical protein
MPVAPNLWGSLLLTAILAVPAVASAQRPVDVGTMRARAESAQKTAGDSGKTAQNGTAAAKPAGPAATKPAGNASAKPAAKAAGTAASKPATDTGVQPSAELAATKPTAPAVKPAPPKPAPPKPAAPAGAAGAAEDVAKTDSLNDPTEAQVLRENFTYGGGARDPFASLIKSANAGPEISDLQLVGIYEDMHYSGNSVAVLREKNSGKRHKLRAGDELGRLRVQQVRSKEVVFTISDFGYQRQETLSLRKQEDVTP